MHGKYSPKCLIFDKKIKICAKNLKYALIIKIISLKPKYIEICKNMNYKLELWVFDHKVVKYIVYQLNIR